MAVQQCPSQLILYNLAESVFSEEGIEEWDVAVEMMVQMDRRDVVRGQAANWGASGADPCLRSTLALHGLHSIRTLCTPTDNG